MNIRARRIAFWRIMNSTLLVLAAALMVFFTVKILMSEAEQKVFTTIGCVVAALFSLLQAIFILSGIKKESNLQKIAYGDVGKINWTAMIFVLVGTLFGIALTVLSLVLLFTKDDAYAVTLSMAILSVAIYLDVNCYIYLSYSIIFRKREINLKNFIK